MFVVTTITIDGPYSTPSPWNPPTQSSSPPPSSKSSYASNNLSNWTSYMISSSGFSVGRGAFSPWYIQIIYIVFNKTTHQHMRSYSSYVAKYSRILAGFTWARYQLCLLISCMVLRSLNALLSSARKYASILHALYIHVLSISKQQEII